MKRNRRLSAVIVAVTLAGLGLLSVTAVGVAASATPRPTRVQASTPQRPLNGTYIFRTYCASCHGTSAMGDGPLAASMRRKPANLTEIAKRNGGVYPSELVYRVIDGRQSIRGHGGPDMPVWGDAFLRTTDGGSEESVRLKIQALVSYLESVQARQGS